MPLKSILIVVSLLFFASCTTKPEYTAEANHAMGLTNDANVWMKGIKIGKVEEVSLGKVAKVYIRFILDKAINLPEDSRFTITQNGLLGNEDLFIEIGKSSRFIKTSDIVQIAEQAATENPLSAIVELISPSPDKCDSLYQLSTKLMRERDSLEYELQKALTSE